MLILYRPWRRLCDELDGERYEYNQSRQIRSKLDERGYASCRPEDVEGGIVLRAGEAA
jgi:hypothetical protein